MHPVATDPGLPLVSDSAAVLPEFDAITTVPAANEFDGLVAVALRFDQVPVPASAAQAPSPPIVAASLTTIRPVCFGVRVRAASGACAESDGVPAAEPPGTPRVGMGDM